MDVNVEHFIRSKVMYKIVKYNPETNQFYDTYSATPKDLVLHIKGCVEYTDHEIIAVIKLK